FRLGRVRLYQISLEECSDEGNCYIFQVHLLREKLELCNKDGAHATVVHLTCRATSNPVRMSYALRRPILNDRRVQLCEPYRIISTVPRVRCTILVHENLKIPPFNRKLLVTVFWDMHVFFI
ncbi:hypothetical protein L9F63_006717, partial [Diploptera punctata]